MAKPSLHIQYERNLAWKTSSSRFSRAWRLIHQEFPFLKPQLELYFCCSGTSQHLNARHRGKNRPTDVLSFSSDQDMLCGSIVVDVEVAKKQARQLGHRLETECLELFIHGCLHLAGFDHEECSARDLMGFYESAFVAKVKN